MILNTKTFSILDGIPLDGTPIPQINSFHLALVGIYYSLAVLGIVFSTVCLVFNFTQRKKKYVFVYVMTNALNT